VLATLALGRASHSVDQAGQPRQVSLVISGGTVVTVDPARRSSRTGAVVIDGDEIVAVDTPGGRGRFTAPSASTRRGT
jgi:adenine deaminase